MRMPGTRNSKAKNARSSCANASNRNSRSLTQQEPLQPTKTKENSYMARLILFLTALLLAVPAIAADDNKGRGSVKKALQADCERQANQQNLIGKERKKFVKNCSKEGKQAKGHTDRDRHVVPPPAQPAAQAASPTPAPAPAPAAPTPGPAQSSGTPTAPATTPPVGTA